MIENVANCPSSGAFQQVPVESGSLCKLISLLCFFHISYFGFVLKHKYKDQNEQLSRAIYKVFAG